MKKIALLTLLLTAFSSHSQDDTYNKFSIEAAYGLSQPFSPKNNLVVSTGENYDVKTFSGFRHFEIGGRYMMNQKYGVKLSYGFDKFQQEDFSDLSVTNHKVGAEMVFNISHLLNLKFTDRGILQVQTHTGFGITFSRPSSIDNTEHIGNFIIGMTPQIKITDRIAIVTDLSYNFIFKQHYYYSGELIDPQYESVTGSFMNISLGLQFYLGRNEFHADWQ